MSTTLLMRDKAIANCIEICKLMKQDENLSEQKFKRIASDVTNTLELQGKSVAFIPPIDFYRLVYNESVIRLNQAKGRRLNSK